MDPVVLLVEGCGVLMLTFWIFLGPLRHRAQALSSLVRSATAAAVVSSFILSIITPVNPLFVAYAFTSFLIFIVLAATFLALYFTRNAVKPILDWGMLIVFGGAAVVLALFFSSFSVALSAVRLETGFYKAESWRQYTDPADGFSIRYPGEFTVIDETIPMADGSSNPQRTIAFRLNAAGTSYGSNKIFLDVVNQPSYYYQNIPVYDGVDRCVGTLPSEGSGCQSFQDPEQIAVGPLSGTIRFETNGIEHYLNMILQGQDRSISLNTLLSGTSRDAMVENIFKEMAGSLTFAQPFVLQDLPAPSADASSTYINKTKGFSITYPAFWTYSDTGQIAFRECGPFLKLPCTGMSPVVFVYATAARDLMPPQQFPNGLEDFINYLAKNYSGVFKNTTTSTLQIAGQSAMKIDYIGRDSKNHQSQHVEIWFVHQNKIYELSYSYYLNDPSAKNDEESVLATFKLL